MIWTEKVRSVLTITEIMAKSCVYVDATDKVTVAQVILLLIFSFTAFRSQQSKAEGKSCEERLKTIGCPVWRRGDFSAPCSSRGQCRALLLEMEGRREPPRTVQDQGQIGHWEN